MIIGDIKSMDSNILVSIINMKLRDEYNSLESLCYDLNLIQEDIINKCKSAGYKYIKEQNQFKSI
ncbi:DUF4250 domain-containing protein [Clostridium sp. CTA-5]